MKTKRYFGLLYFIILLMAVLPAVAKKKTTEVSPEFRAAWVHRWEWPHFDPETCKQKIRTIFDDLQRANFNAVVFQIRGQADVFYPSPDEPWSPLIGAKDPGWDPLAFAIEEAHKRGLEFHAYVNPMPLWHTGVTPESHIPEGSDYEPSRLPAHTSPEHLYYRHGPDAEVSWVCQDATGNPMKVRDNGYYYMAASIPGVQAYIRTVFLDLVERYDIDGIHYDRIRTPGPGYSYDPISVRRFEDSGNPNGLSLGRLAAGTTQQAGGRSLC